MSTPDRLGGIIHTYQKFDPVNLPSPTAPPPDLVSPAFEHLLTYGSLRELTDEELSRLVHLDPSMIAGFGPSLEALMEILRERKRTDRQKQRNRQACHPYLSPHTHLRTGFRFSGIFSFGMRAAYGVMPPRSRENSVVQF